MDNLSSKEVRSHISTILAQFVSKPDFDESTPAEISELGCDLIYMARLLDDSINREANGDLSQ